MDGEAAILGDFHLAPFDLGVQELFHLATLEAYQVIVVTALVQLEHRLAGLEMVPDQNAGLLELRQNAINRGKPDLHAFVEQDLVDVFGGQVPHVAVLEQIEDFQARQGRFQSDVLQIVGCTHVGTDRQGRVNYHSGFQSAWKPCAAPAPMRAPIRMRLLFLLPMLLLAGCMLAPHKINIQQGNYIDEAMVAKLKADMTRSQVRFILGTPLIADVFHQNRWDYVFLTGKVNNVRVQHKITVIFDGDKLKQVEGDVVPVDKLSQAAPGTGKP